MEVCGISNGNINGEVTTISSNDIIMQIKVIAKILLNGDMVKSHTRCLGLDDEKVKFPGDIPSPS